jgi:precorrin-2 dehydrogenase/sirohydrochlorin ferrochelatase
MARYPVMLDMAGRLAVVVGGGRVAERKVGALLEAGAAVRVVGPTLTEALAARAAEGHIDWRQRRFAAGDLAGAALAFAATDRREVNAAVLAEARAAGVPCNVADDPGGCDFQVPSVVRRGDLVIAVSTGGASPAVARRVRQALEERFGPEWAAYLDLLAAARAAALAPGDPPDASRELLADLADLDLLPLLREGRWAEVERALLAAAERRLGSRAAARFTLAALGMPPAPERQGAPRSGARAKPDAPAERPGAAEARPRPPAGGATR